MLQLHSIAFAPFAAAETLNPGFAPGHPKMRLTVDAEPAAGVPDALLLERLVASFPGLARHHCTVPEARPGEPARGIVLLESDTTANQAHLLEHLLLEMLSELDGATRLSGATCAYASPPERSDIFVECADPESGGFAALVAIEAMNTALAGELLEPLYPDVLRCARWLRARPAATWPATRLGRCAGIPAERAEAALEVLARARFVEAESYTMNFSGDPHYRFVGTGEASRRQ